MWSCTLLHIRIRDDASAEVAVSLKFYFMLRFYYQFSKKRFLLLRNTLSRRSRRKRTKLLLYLFITIQYSMHQKMSMTRQLSMVQSDHCKKHIITWQIRPCDAHKTILMKRTHSCYCSCISSQLVSLQIYELFIEYGI